MSHRQFTGFRTLLASIAAACLDRSVFGFSLNHAVERHNSPHPAPQPVAPVQTDGAAARGEQSGNTKPHQSPCQRKGYASIGSRTTLPIPGFKAPSDRAAQQWLPQIAGSEFESWCWKSQEAQTLKSPPIARFSEFSRRAEISSCSWF